jgi:high frequency lysogenization protein
LIVPKPDNEQTLALAGMLQSAVLVNQLARTADWDRSALHDSTFSLIRLEETSAEKIFGGYFGVDLGLRSIIKFFAAKPDNDVREIYNYAAAAHQLSLKLLKMQRTSDVIHNELVEFQSRFLPSQEDEDRDIEVQAALAGLYSRTISYLTPRIIVHGDPDQLQDPDTVSRVRTALFSGIRAGFLWHHLGGRRWHLLFNRRGYIQRANLIMTG